MFRSSNRFESCLLAALVVSASACMGSADDVADGVPRSTIAKIQQFKVEAKVTKPDGTPASNLSFPATLIIQGDGAVARSAYYGDEGGRFCSFRDAPWSDRFNPGCDEYIGRSLGRGDRLKRCDGELYEIDYGKRPVAFWETTITKADFTVESQGVARSVFDISGGTSFSQTLGSDCEIEDIRFETVDTVMFRIQSPQADGSVWKAYVSLFSDEIVAENDIDGDGVIDDPSDGKQRSKNHKLVVDREGNATLYADIQLSSFPADAVPAESPAPVEPEPSEPIEPSAAE